MFNRYSSCNWEDEKLNLKKIKDVILNTRRKDIENKKPKELSCLWYETLAIELVSGVFKSKKIYDRILDKLPGFKAL